PEVKNRLVRHLPRSDAGHELVLVDQKEVRRILDRALDVAVHLGHDLPEVRLDAEIRPPKGPDGKSRDIVYQAQPAAPLVHDRLELVDVERKPVFQMVEAFASLG